MLIAGIAMHIEPAHTKHCRLPHVTLAKHLTDVMNVGHSMPHAIKHLIDTSLLSLACTAQVRPLRRQLKTLKAWITGQRKDQSPGTRADIPIVQSDPAFEGLAGGPGSLIKFNPLSNMSSEAIWNFLRVMVMTTAECMLAVRNMLLG